MKNMMKYLGILLLLSVAITSIVYIGSSNVTATSVSPTPTPTATPTFTSFYNCVFGVRIFPGADPMGAYTVNPPFATYGSVSGHFNEHLLRGSQHIIAVYLSTSNTPVFSDHEILGNSATNLPFGSFITTTDNNGYYSINNVPLGHYYVYWAKSTGAANLGHGIFVQSVDLTTSAPNAIADISLMDD